MKTIIIIILTAIGVFAVGIIFPAVRTWILIIRDWINKHKKQ